MTLFRWIQGREGVSNSIRLLSWIIQNPGQGERKGKHPTSKKRMRAILQRQDLGCALPLGKPPLE